MAKKPSVGITAVLLLAAGLVLGISTLPGEQSLTASVAGDTSPSPEVLGTPSSPAFEPEPRDVTVDPEAKVHESFIECSADYADGPGTDLDKKNMIGPENSVMVSPEEMKALGRPEAEIQAQTARWDELSPEEREEQLCRAAQQNAVIGQ
ncbi:hypothetical protein [Arthrobacter crystallopoietes]|uniref:hypothetical protein n=1 Tax=Crystallibacter crystallopoietes TaxID=37928 RepID=UPI0011110467|nr:hypothetical protein [Arthrobacter crystallopoietes]